MWEILGKLIAGPVFDDLLKAYQARLASINSTDQHAIDLATADYNAQVEARKLAVALAANRVSAAVQTLFALPYVIFAWKVVVWDKVLGALTHGTTDALAGDVASWGGIVIGFFMGGQILGSVANKIAGRFAK
jgi:hypothetical protein